jgi:peptide chain release factor 1
MSLFDRVEPHLSQLEQRFVELDAQMADPEVVQDAARMQAILIERGRLEQTVRHYRDVSRLRQELAEARQERDEADDPEMRQLCEDVIEELSETIPAKEEELLAAFVTDPDDNVNRAIVEIRAGTGGDEATLWANDLMRMYGRFCERRRFKIEMLSENRSTVDGIKEAVFAVKGAGCYAALKFESGGHRVQRVPTTETQGRIHTSAATVAVLLEPSEVDVQVNEAEDLKIETYRSSGPGGQKVNKTDSAIRITHLPTGLVVSIQDEKSQHKNRAKAMKVLRTRLHDLERQKIQAERASARKSLVGSGDRSQKIRTYNYPQSRVTDHRINLNVHNLQGVLDGDLTNLVESLARHEQEQRLQSLAESDTLE